MKKRFVLICGPQGAGKTTLAKAIGLVGGNKRVVGLKFADPLYTLHEKIWNTLEDYGLKKENFLKSKIDGRLLQLLGSEWGRSMDKDIWVKIMQERVAIYPPSTILVIDDCRFENELRVFDRDQTVLIRLHAPESVRKLRAEKWREDTTHISETGLNHIKDDEFDFIFETLNLKPETMAELIIDEIDNG